MRLQLNSIAALCAAAWAGTAAAGDADPAPVQPPSIVARATGETSLYADTNDVTVLTPVAVVEVRHPLSEWRVQGQYLVDVISAASVDIVSTASPRWEEVRHEGSLEVEYQPGDLGVRAHGTTSQEPDYSAFAGGGAVFLEFGEARHVLFAGYTRGHDTIGRTGTPFDVFSRALDKDTMGAGVTAILSRATALSTLAEVMLERGNQSKPYRYIPLFTADVAESLGKGTPLEDVNALRLPERPIEHLPESRQRYAVTARLGHRSEHGTLRVDERLYADSWDLRATTTEIRYFADLSRRWMLWPRLRVHAQSAAYFWRRAYVAEPAGSGLVTVPELRAGDHELGPLATVGAGLGASFGMGRLEAPSSLRLYAQLDGEHTRFLNDLYMTSRTAMIGMLGLEGLFE